MKLVVQTPRGHRWWEVFHNEDARLCVRLIRPATAKSRGKNKTRELHYDPETREFWFKAVAAGYVVRARFTGEVAARIRKMHRAVLVERVALSAQIFMSPKVVAAMKENMEKFDSPFTWLLLDAVEALREFEGRKPK